MTAFLKRVAAARPLVLVLDDLHAADEPSLLLLQFVARELGESRLLIVGAYRDVDPTLADPLTTTLTELAREPVTRTLALAGLAEADVARFIELAAPGASAGELGAVVHAETEGNPLFVGEVVRLLAAEGRLDEPASAPLAIPQSVREVIGRRLRHLSDDCNRLLTFASVLGREFDLDALAGVSGLERGGILELLDEAIEARVVSEVPGAIGRMRFAHALIRDAAYHHLTRSRRIQLHRPGRRGPRGPLLLRPRPPARRARASLLRVRRRWRQTEGGRLRAAGRSPRRRPARLRGGSAPIPDGARGTRLKADRRRANSL